MFASYVITFLISCYEISAQTAETNPKQSSNGGGNLGAYSFPPGDPRICIDISRRRDSPLKRFSSLPGIGWDNLRNEAAGQVYDFNYSKCRETEDGQYLIPDAVFTIPIKSSRVETFADIYESWNNVTSITSRSINVDASLGIGSFGISGSYSSEHTRVKRKQIHDDTVAARVQLRYLRYKAKLQPGSPLHPVFRSRLMSIAADLNQNMTQSAFYKAQLLVRDYGTHVLKTVVAGACLVKTDFLRHSYVASHNTDKRVVTAAASASFASTFKLDASFKQSSTDEEVKAYKKSTTFSYITTHGGPIYRPYDMTVSQWVHDIDTEMVPMDRSGDPLYYTITAQTFPGLPVPLIELLEENVQKAVSEYYEMNTIRGCTKRGSPNFSYTANVDDSSCVKTLNNLTFGGVYQTCSVVGKHSSSNPCTGMTQVNPLTKGNVCPPDYTRVLLHSGVKFGEQESSKKCERCGFLWLKKCCHTNYYQAEGHYSTFWCAATNSVPRSSGYLFGGMWSTMSTNLVTKTKKCPPLFYPLRILQEHFICVSDDYELAEPHAVPFGGLTSCSAGNPLAVSRGGNSKTQLDGFMQELSRWPKRCPEGFSQHLAAVDDGCAIRYCIKTGALSTSYLPPVRRPPFSSKPETIRRVDVLTIINSDNSIQDGGMIVPQNVYNLALEGYKIIDAESSVSANYKASGAVGILSSSLLTALTCMVGLVWSRFGA